MDDLERLATLVAQRSEIEHGISAILQRPASPGHLGEFVAARVFGIELEHSAAAKGIDGRFSSPPLRDRTVNVKWYRKHEGLLDIPRHELLPDYFLVLSGPKSSATTSRGVTRPWCIDHVFLFETIHLLKQLAQRGVKIGVATSVASAFWAEAEIYPEQRSSRLVLTDAQRSALALFAST